MANYGPFAPAQIDFSWLANLPDQFEKGGVYGRQRNLRNALPNIDPNDTQAMARALMQADPALGVRYAQATAQQQATQAYREADLGLKREALTRPKPAFNPVTGQLIDQNSGQPIGGGGGGGDVPNPYFGGAKTADQSRAQGFFNDAVSANSIVGELGSGVGEESSVSQAARAVPPETGFGIVGSIANSFVDVDASKLDNAARRWVNAINYRDSGAQVNQTELRNAYENYIPRKGDRPELIAQKAEARRIKLESLASQGGPMFQPNMSPGSPQQSNPPAQYQDGQTATNPQTGQKLLFQNGAWVPVR